MSLTAGGRGGWKRAPAEAARAVVVMLVDEAADIEAEAGNPTDVSRACRQAAKMLADSRKPKDLGGALDE